MATRLISSGVGIIIVFAVFFLHNTAFLPLILCACTLIILFELARAIGGEKSRLALGAVMVYGFCEPLLDYLLVSGTLTGGALEMTVTVKQLLLPVCLLALFVEILWHHGKFTVEQLCFMGGFMCYVPWSLEKLIELNYTGDGSNGLFYLVLALCGAWIADSGAYFSGIALGKHKLCPGISPKKTVEGFIGGILSNAVIFLAIFAVYAHIRSIPFAVTDGIKAALLGIVCAGISVVGDLFFSVIKREKGIKDYGKIMPGHGGLTDRFDSVLFVVPAFYLFVQTFSIF